MSQVLKIVRQEPVEGSACHVHLQACVVFPSRDRNRSTTAAANRVV